MNKLKDKIVLQIDIMPKGTIVRVEDFISTPPRTRARNKQKRTIRTVLDKLVIRGILTRKSRSVSFLHREEFTWGLPKLWIKNR